MVDVSDPRKTRLLTAGWLSTVAEAHYFAEIWCALEELLSWFLFGSLPNACKSLRTHTKDFLTLEKCVSVFWVCAVWVLLRWCCHEVTFGLSWGQCFLFVSDLSGKKYMKTKQKHAVCSWGSYAVVTYLLRIIVKAGELHFTSLCRRALYLPVRAGGWLPPLPHQTTGPTWTGTVCSGLPGGTEQLPACCLCAYTCPLPAALGKWCSLPCLGVREWALIGFGPLRGLPNHYVPKGKVFFSGPRWMCVLAQWGKRSAERRGDCLQYQHSSARLPRGSQKKKLPGPGNRLDKLFWRLQADLVHV